MDNERQNEGNSDERRNRPATRNPNLLIPLIFIAALVLWMLFSWGEQSSTISYRYFENLLQGLNYDGQVLKDDNGEPLGCVIEQVEFTARTARGIFRVIPPPEPSYNAQGELVQPKPDAKLNKHFVVYLSQSDQARSETEQAVKDAGVKSIKFEANSGDLFFWYYAALIMFSFGLLLFMILSFRRSQSQMMGGGGFLSNFSAARPKNMKPPPNRLRSRTSPAWKA